MQSVVEELAAQEGVDPLDLDVPLYDAIDPDALNALFSPTNDGTERAGGRIVFTIDGYEVTVDGDGQVDAREL